MAEKGTAFSHIKTQRVTKRSQAAVGMQPDIIHSDDFEAIFGLYRSENMRFQSRSNDDGG